MKNDGRSRFSDAPLTVFVTCALIVAILLWQAGAQRAVSFYFETKQTTLVFGHFAAVRAAKHTFNRGTEPAFLQ